MATDLYVMYAVYALYMACGFICCIASPAGRNVRWKNVVITYAAPAGRASNKFKENTLPCLSQTGEGFSLNLKLDEMDAHAVCVVCVQPKCMCLCACGKSHVPVFDMAERRPSKGLP